MNSLTSAVTVQRSLSNRTWRGLMVAVTALAFFLRLRALTRFQFHIDEFFTLTAADLIAKSGVPRYPTGLFYDPGLPFSYLDGLLFRLFGFSEALGRWPSVMFGTLAVVTVYWLGSRVLRSPAVGLLAALWFALSLESVEWSGRARMITLAQWLGLMALALLWLGLTHSSVRHRLGFILCYAGTLLTHFSTVVLMPAWFVAAAALWWAKVIDLQRVLLRDTLLLLLGFGLAISLGIIFQPPPTVEFQTSKAGLDAKAGILTNKFLQIPSDIGHAWEAYGPYFGKLPHGPVLILAALGLLISIWRLKKSRSLMTSQPNPGSPGSALNHHPAKHDIGALFLGAVFLTAMLTLILVIAPHWQRSRYLLMQVQGIFLLLGAHGCRELMLWITSTAGQKIVLARQQALWPVSGTVIVTGALSIPFLSALQPVFEAEGRGWNRYDQAFGLVREKLGDGDKVMSMHPPASLLYLNQSDYYLVQSSPKLIIRPDGTPGDRYSGAVWLQSADDVNQLLLGPDKVWLVAQEFWLFNSYDALLQQQILGQMDKIWGEGGVWALSSRQGSWPLARDVDAPLQAEFQGGTRLVGMSGIPTSLTPAGVLQLTLFWQGPIPQGVKVFIHLRNADNGTVSQADHFIYDDKVPSSRWPALLKNDTMIRDGATLHIPSDLEPGVYRLVTGFYHPESFERLGVINDQSGENGVVLREWNVK